MSGIHIHPFSIDVHPSELVILDGIGIQSKFFRTLPHFSRIRIVKQLLRIIRPYKGVSLLHDLLVIHKDRPENLFRTDQGV